MFDGSDKQGSPPPLRGAKFTVDISLTSRDGHRQHGQTPRASFTAPSVFSRPFHHTDGWCPHCFPASLLLHTAMAEALRKDDLPESIQGPKANLHTCVRE